MFDTPQQPALTISLRFPATWRKESIEWAKRRGLTQAQIDSLEAELVRFRAIRDAFAAEYARAA